MTTQERIEKAEDLIKKGMPINLAAEEAGIHPSTVYYHRNRKLKPKKKPKVIDLLQADLEPAIGIGSGYIDVTKQTNLVMLVGSPEKILSVLKGLI